MSIDFPKNWKQVVLEDALDALIDYRGKTPKKVDKGIPLITAKVVKSGRILPMDEFIADEDYESWMVRGIPQISDIVVTTEAPLGEVAQIKNANVALAQRIVTLRGKVDFLENDFLLFLMQSDFVQNQLEARATGSTVKGIKQSELRKIILPIPPIVEQKCIGKILSDLDDKIHLNNQINQTLESIAQAIFKSWFIDFDPVRAKITAKREGKDPELTAMCAISGKSEVELQQMTEDDLAELRATASLFPDELMESELGEVPKGWDAITLGNFLEIKRGGSPRPIQNFMAPTGYPWVKIADATADPSPFLFKTKEFIIKEGLRKTVYLKKGSLILTNSATPGLPKFLELDACIHDGWLYFPQKKHFSDNYLYFLFLKLRTQLVAQGNGSVFTNLKTDILRNQVVLVPTREVIEKFDLQVGKILEMMKTQCIQSSNLSDLRDTLLPKLLSGKVSVLGFQGEVA
ncbi:restriction endonuclease subunit S [Acinetobacter johnsonii]|uniref:restriction endonuclease subunit S n=1 Tax=Acinetobacter johnsonii TaxID=40214 RepID=UPI0032B3CF5C